ncbi:TlpA family protein disulfide reductase [Rhizomonospora bruguierae]|uniref:TlpA family protein disulfide reductase n=1 Tax=Rhizomonospora bruguierae TaxID=1581705 RepID=UPI001BD03E96|nr:thioredoxin family protein [Micromonospora sp. NBRC 107566]
MDPSPLAGGAVGAVVLVGSTVYGLWRRRRDGAFRSAGGAELPARSANDDASDDGSALLRALGVEAGIPATLLQFSSAFCAPCRATRRLCGEVSALLDGVRHVEVDAESHLEAVRALEIWCTPTVLVVDAAGRIAGRATGQPTKAQLIAAVAPLLAAPTEEPEVAR